MNDIRLFEVRRPTVDPYWRGRIRYRPRGRGEWRVRVFAAKSEKLLRKKMEKWHRARLRDGFLIEGEYK